MSKIKKFFRKFIGTKTFYKELITVSLPIAMQQLISAIVNLLDGLMVSGYGSTDAIEGVAVASKYFTCFNNIMNMFAISCSVFITQFFGAKMKEKIKRSFGVSLIVCMTFSLISLAVGLILRGPIMELFTGGVTTNQAAFDYGVSYLSIVVFSFIPQAITNSFTSSFRAIKKTQVPFFSACIAACTNAFLNWVLIGGNLGVKPMGTAGAALATCIARVVELTIQTVYFTYTKPAFYGSFKEIFNIDKELFSGIIKRSLPLVCAQFLTEALSIFMLFVYARLELGNSVNVASVNIAQQVNDIVVVFVSGLGSAASVLVGSRLGQNKIEEARTHARWQLAYAFFFSLFSMGLMIVSRRLVCNLYHITGEESNLLMIIMLIQALSFPFMIFAHNVIFISRAGGYTKAPLFITDLVYYCVKLPIIILFVWIVPQFYTNIIEGFMSSVGLIPSFVVFIFVLDKFAELLRATVAMIVYKKAPWYKNISYIGKPGQLEEAKA